LPLFFVVRGVRFLAPLRFASRALGWQALGLALGSDDRTARAPPELAEHIGVGDDAYDPAVLDDG